MSELIIYAVVFVLLIGHCLFAGKMYRAVHENSSMTLSEKNDWKLKALIFPVYFWGEYKKVKR